MNKTPHLRIKLYLAFVVMFLMSALTVTVAVVRIGSLGTVQRELLAGTSGGAGLNRETLEKARVTAVTEADSVRNQLLLLLALTLVTGCAGAWWATGALKRRVSEVESDADALLRGNFTGVAEKRSDADDELSAIGDAQKVMARDVLALSRELEFLAEASREGELTRRLNVSQLKGEWAVLARNINTILDEAIGPINAQAAVLQKMAEGTLTARVTDEFRGDHNRIKNAINRVADLAATAMEEVEDMVRASRDGDMGKRAEARRFVGDWNIIMSGVNTVLDEAIGPINAQAATLQQMAEGTLTARITDNFRGDHNRIKNAINRVADIATLAMVEVDLMVRASRDGDLNKRADAQRFVGDWHIIMSGVNTVLDEAIGPINAQAEALQKMAEGTLTARITDNFRGDHNRIKNSINRVADIATLAMVEVDGMIQASREGDLNKRADARRFVGDWQLILSGVNTVLDEAIGPINAQAATLQQMAEGILTARITDDFQGDHNRIKNAVNQVSTLALGAIDEFDGLITAFESGDFGCRAREDKHQGDWQKIMGGLNRILATVHRSTQQMQAQNWVKTGISELAEQMRGDLAIADLSRQVIVYLARYVDAQIGAFYLWNEDDHALHLRGSYAYRQRKEISNRFILGEGLVGQAALEKQLISVTELPEDYVRITSGIGEVRPKNSLVMPLVYENDLKGVIELGRVREFDQLTMDLLTAAADAIAVALNTAESNDRTRILLVQTQEQAERLQLQQEELQQNNEELEEQAQSLKATEEELRAQQEELQQTNEELEERTQLLESQRTEITKKNSTLEKAQADLQRQTEDLAIASKYKSEFLANMSHELRTPLNSMLLLSRSLADNRAGNLTEKQIKSAEVMYQSGNDLLSIINDILDLSKIEAGCEVAVQENVNVQEVCDQLDGLYRHVAEEKGLTFVVDVAEDIPTSIRSDRGRLGQILRNLLSNSFKFTPQGSVTLRFGRPTADVSYQRSSLQKMSDPSQRIIAIEVIDTGIGIETEKQKHIWEAFQQADGSTSRQYGGTGLGLTISRELAKLLGGEICLTSKKGEGTTFTFYLPQQGGAAIGTEGGTATDAPAQPSARTMLSSYSQSRKAASPLPTASVKNGKKVIGRIADDRENLGDGDVAILIVEDDLVFAQLAADTCHTLGMKYLACPTADEAMELLVNYRVKGVLLDMELPEKSGWAVLSGIKETLATMHIPVYVLSSDERYKQSLQYGAVGFLQKPATREQIQVVCETVCSTVRKKVKNVLLIEDDQTLRDAVHDLLDTEGVSIREASTGVDALGIIRGGNVDLIVLDLGLPDMSGFELLKLAFTELGDDLPPVIIFTGRDLTQDEYEQLQNYAAKVIIKGVRSHERLVEEAALMLHRRVDSLPDRARKMLSTLRDKEALFTGKQVLLVDDDIRNVFSLSGLLEERGLKVVTARNGKDGLDRLAEHPDIDMILTDIMMPVMDGYEFMRKIRGQNRYKSLPILALTAKAMKEDRDLCMAAGASDYLAKPIEVNRLFSVLRVWLYR